MADPSCADVLQGSGSLQRPSELLRTYISDPQAPEPGEVHRLVSELEIRQAELETQNRHLQEAQRQLAAYRDRYVDLYDFAPLGYVTLDEDGYVQEINLAGAKMLGEDRDLITGYAFADYVAKEDQNAFQDHVRKCAGDRCEATCELRLVVKDGQSITVQLRSMPVEGPKEDVLCKTAITDISQRRKREQRVARLTALKEQLLGPSALNEKLKLITDGVVEVFGADFARIWVLDEGDRCDSGCHHATSSEVGEVCRDHRRCLHLVASSGRYTAIDGAHCRVPLGCYKVGRVASGEEPKFVSNDVTHDPRVHDHGWAASLGLVSFAGYRLLSPKGSPLGVLALFSKRAIDADEDALLEDLANTAAQVIRTGRAEESLRREKAFADIVIDSIPGVFYVLDSQGRFVRWNRLLEEVTGLLPDALPGTDALTTIFADDRQLVAGRIREVFEKGEAEVESRFLAKDGIREFWFTGRRMDVGSTSYLVGSGIDITDRKLAKEAIEKDRTLLRTLIDSLPDSIYIKDTEGRFVTANLPAARVMGAATPSDLVGKTDFDFYPEQRAVEYRDDEQQVLQSGEALVNKDEPHLDPTGTLRAVLTTKVPLKDGDGQVVGLVGISRDITDRKRAEEAIVRLNEELQMANRDLEAFTSSVCHDLRKPLHTIGGFSEILSLEYVAKLDETAKDYLVHIASGVRHMAALIDDLMELSRVTQAEMQRAVVDLSGVVWAILEELRKGQPEREVECVVREGVAVEGDPRLLRVALENLLGNAWKFTGKQDKASIEFGVMAQGGERVFFIRDNGAGFDMQSAQKLFGVFRRLHSPEEFEGTGVGLATVERIIRAHGGRVWAEAAVERGATFFFTLSNRAVANPLSPQEAPFAPTANAGTR